MGKSSDQVIHNEHDDSADYGDEHAPKIEPRDTCPAETLEQPATNNASDNPQDNVEEEAFPLSVYDLASYETGDQSENDPADD